jgi:pimeloyl-ACP methyl ester carboxylesterase
LLCGRPLSADGHAPPAPDFSWEDHVILISPDGNAVDPDNQSTLKTDFSPLFAKIPNDRKILIFIQGGLTAFSDAIDRASDVRRHTAIDQAGYYPIFVGWNSNLGSSFAEQFTVDRGRQLDPVRQPIAGVLVGVADLGGMAAKAPLTLFNQLFVTDIQRVKPEGSYYDNQTQPVVEPAKGFAAEAMIVNNEYRQLLLQPSGTALHVSLGGMSNPPSRDHEQIASYWLTLPGKIVFSPVIETGGLTAWQRMRGRVINMFYPPYESDLLADPGLEQFPEWRYAAAVAPDDTSPPNRPRVAMASGLVRHPRVGALYLFMNQLEEAMKTRPPGITLVAHSAGAIIACEMLARFPDITYQRIVFMAAACSLNDFQRSVIPYLQVHDDPKPDAAGHVPSIGDPTEFYNLCLHPQHEIDEWRLGDTYSAAWAFAEPIAERGSLLEWIDNFYSTPESFMDRMLGKWTNAIEASHIIPTKIRNFVTIKGFGYNGAQPYIPVPDFDSDAYMRHAQALQNGGGPQTHGEFSEWPFWEPWFFEANPAPSP